MPSMDFFLTSFVVALIPGTGVLYTINVALARKTGAGIAAAAGCTLGIVPHMVACALGLSAAMNAGAHVFMAVKWAGIAYLLYLAWKTWVAAGKGAPTTEADGKGETGYVSIAAKGIAVNLLNPKLTLFFLAFLPQFMGPAPDDFNRGIAFLGAIFMAITFAVFILYGLAAGVARGVLLGSARAMKSIERGFAVVFAGIAVKLALSDR